MGLWENELSFKRKSAEQNVVYACTLQQIFVPENVSIYYFGKHKQFVNPQI